MSFWWQELDKPPSPEQMQFWARMRQRGRRHYIWLGVRWATLLWIGIILVVKLLGLLLFQQVFWEGMSMVPVGPVLGWLACRERWAKNERRFVAAAEERPA